MTASRPAAVQALLFDVDGVLTDTAAVHARAWKETFEAIGQPFDLPADYEAYVDGRSRLDGVRTFLAARGVDLPEGDPDDGPDARTIQGVGRRKNDRLLELIREDGVRGYDDA